MNDDHELVLDAIAGREPNSKGWVRVNCPLCETAGALGPDRRVSLGVNENGWYTCWRCHSKGKLKADDLSAYASRKPRSKAERSTEPEVIGKPEGYLPLWCEPAAGALSCQPALRYLAQRGVERQLIRKAGIGICLSGYFAHRLVVPVHDLGHEWAGFVTRTWYKAKRHYLYPAGMDRQRLMYNGEALDIETDEPVLCVEGSFDSFPYLPHVAAFLGKPTEHHKSRLREAKRPVAIVLDADAWQEGQALAWELQLDGVRAGYVVLEPGSDPADSDHDWVKAQARACIREQT